MVITEEQRSRLADKLMKWKKQLEVLVRLNDAQESGSLINVDVNDLRLAHQHDGDVQRMKGMCMSVFEKLVNERTTFLGHTPSEAEQIEYIAPLAVAIAFEEWLKIELAAAPN